MGGVRSKLFVCTVVAVLLGAASTASADDRVYWSNSGAIEIQPVSAPGAIVDGPPIGLADLDGSGGADLATSGATASIPYGTAIDSAAAKIYWANFDDNSISYANLDGSGGGDLNTTGSAMTGPEGVAIDPVAGRIYWANRNGDTIGYAALDGSGGGAFNTTGANVSGPAGVAVDLTAGRLYWANSNNSTISYANLDGTGGGGNLATTGATINNPQGLAIDESSGRIYWTYQGLQNPDFAKGNVGPLSGISYANLDGTGGGGNLDTTGATVQDPRGVAIDQNAGRVYWANQGLPVQCFRSSRVACKPSPGSDGQGGGTGTGAGISYANLDGSGGGGDLIETGATKDASSYPSLQKEPRGTGIPAITGGDQIGVTLSCSQGSWAADKVEAFLFREPSEYAYSWSRDGTPIPGANSNSYSPDQGGSYTCTVTGTNEAGSDSQTSDPLVIGSTCPAVAIDINTYTPRPRQNNDPRKPGVRSRINVGEPSELAIDSELEYVLGGNNKTADLGHIDLRNDASRNLRIVLEQPLKKKLPLGTDVTLNLAMEATPDSEPDCVNPPTVNASLDTKVRKVLPMTNP